MLLIKNLYRAQLLYSQILIAKSSLFLFSTTLLILSISGSSSDNILVKLSTFRAEAAPPQQADIYNLFIDSPIPPETRESLVTNSSISALRSYLEAFQNFTGSSAASNVTTHPQQQVIVYYDFRLVPVDSDNQSHELLMLKFADNTSKSLAGSSIDYNVEMNGTEFNFQGNGTTLTGADLKIVRTLPLAETSINRQNYSMAIDILDINGTAVSEKTEPLIVQITS